MQKHLEAKGRSDKFRLLEELGILRFKNTTVGWISRARIQFDDIIQ